MAVQFLALCGLLIGTLAAFGGSYPWALPFVVTGAALVLLLGGTTSWRLVPDARLLYVAFTLLVVAVALQCVPLPAGLRAWISPAAGPLESAVRPDALVRGTLSFLPLSIDTRASVGALALLVAVAFTYQAALGTLARGGVRQLARVLAVTGVVVAIGAAVQLAVSPLLIYGFWAPETRGAQPFGPVVNRNHLVAWFVMAGALASGYMVARLRTRLDGPVLAGSWRRVLKRVNQSGAPSMAAAWAVMALAVVVSQSRSGIIGLAVALAVLWRGGRARRWDPRIATVFALLVASGVAVVVMVTDVPAVAGRFASSFGQDGTGRPVIWRETMRVIADFWLAGTGAGTFGAAMTVYQQTLPFAPHLDSYIHFNHAHNHYLHVAAEGGLLLFLPALLTVGAFARLAAQRLREERGELLWLRLGAFSGLVAVAVLSIWEIPLTMPANALLAATLAAIVTYRRTGD